VGWIAQLIELVELSVKKELVVHDQPVELSVKKELEVQVQVLTRCKKN
jgi:hypothetical protein